MSRKPIVTEAEASRVVMILPDIHFPNQDVRSLNVVLEVAQRLAPTEIVLLGDMADCAPFSAHKPSSPEESIDWIETEISPLCRFLKDLDANILTLLEGNHEARIQREIAKMGHVGYALKRFDFHSVLFSEAGEHGFGFQWVPYNKTDEAESFYEIVKPTTRMKSGGLVAVHGWSHAKSAADKHLALARDRSIVFGHCHRRAEVTDRNRFTDTPLISWCPGTLSELQPFWMHGGQPTSHVNGFSIVYIGDKSWTHYNIMISRGSAVLPDGSKVKA